MTYTPQPPPPAPGPQHPAAAYYPGPALAAPRDLTVFAVLAFASAAAVTVLAALDAAVVGRAVRLGGPEGAATLDWSLAAFTAIAFLQLGAAVATWVFASLWLHRARINARALEPTRPHSRSAGWAWGGWICPVVCLWFPFQVVRDVHRAISPTSTSTLIGWWWALLLAATLGQRVLDNAEGDAITTGRGAEGVQSGAVFVTVLLAAALLLWGLVLRRITREQHARMYAARPGTV